jgi:Heliorhodopsin
VNTVVAPPIANGITEERLKGLRLWNLGLAALHLLQAIAILVLTGGFKITVTSTVPEGPPGTRTPAATEVFKLPIGITISAFLLLAALDHFITATVARGAYERDLRRGINRFRWIEYSVSATLMIVLISMYGGTTSIDALFAIIGCNVAMILFGWLQEVMNPPGRTTTTMLPFWFGVVAGIAPWLAIAYNVIGSKTVPGFVYGIIITEAVLFFSFALNQWLQYRQIGKWGDYAYGEKTYLVLSLVAKSLLAWQIFGGSLSGK